MPRNAWTAAGEELKGFADYMDQRGDRQRRADEYSTMVELRRQNIMNQMAREQRAAKDAERKAEYDQNMLNLRQDQAEREKMKWDFEKNKLASEQQREQQAATAMQTYAGLVLDANKAQGTEGAKPLTHRDYELMMVKAGLNPGQIQKLSRTFQDPKGNPGGMTWKQKYDYKRANPMPSTANPPALPQVQRNAQAMTPQGAARNYGTMWYNQDQIRGMERNIVTGAEDPLYSSTNSSIKRAQEILNNYGTYNQDPILLDRAAANSILEDIRAEKGRPADAPFTRADYIEAAQRLAEAKRQR